MNEVLDYSRIVSGKFTFDAKLFDMGKILDEVTATMRSQANEKDLKNGIYQKNRLIRIFIWVMHFG